MDGLINLLKEPGVTSHDLVLILRRLFKIQKVGHAGTLDPGAAGVLPVCVGQGTRVAEFLINKPKQYRAEITFGIQTDTFDAGGKIIKKNPNTRLQLPEIKDVLKSYRGEIKQVPPMVSALHYQGKRLYKLARQGKTVDLKARRITIHSLEIVAFLGTMPYPRLILDISCSKGTYIRSLCADIGKELGCGAYLSFLIRTATGPFQLIDAFTLAEIKALWEEQDYSFLLPVDFALRDLPALTVKEKAVDSVLNGRPLAPSGITGGVGNHDLPELVRLYTPDGRLLALGYYQAQQGGAWLYKPKKVFRLLHS